MQIHVIWYCVLIFHDRTNIVKCYELWFAPIHTTPLKRTLHPKMDASVLLGWPMFRGYISFREGILYIIFITYTRICVMKTFHSYYQSRDKPFIFEISHAQIFFTFYWHIHIQLWYHIIILCFFVPRRPRNTGLSSHFLHHLSLSRSVATPKKKPLWAVQLPEDMKRILESKF